MQWKSHFLRHRDVCRYGLALLTLTGAYLITGRLGLLLEPAGGFATFVWFPSGLAVSALFLRGFRLWPAITVGAFLVNLFTGAPWFVAVGMSIGNTLEALVCTALLKREKVHPAMNELRDILILVLLAVPLSAVISATFGVGSLSLGRVINWSLVSVTWSTWWFGDMMSMLLLVPLLLTWSVRLQVSLTRTFLMELSLIGLFVLVIGLFVFLGLFQPKNWHYPVLHLVFPPLIWAALRFGPRGATAVLATFAMLALAGSLLGVSPFSTGNLWFRLLCLQSFLGVTAVTTLFLATIVAERRAIEKRKDAFITLINHELRTPLTVVLGSTQLLQRQLAGSQDTRVLRALARLETRAKRLSQMFIDLCDLSSIQMGKLLYEEERVDINTLVREVVEQLQPDSPQRQISIEGSAPEPIVGDRMRLRQVLINLLSNAMNYSAQRAQVIVRLHATTENVTVGVQDFGCGISNTEQEKIFERFYRVDGEQGQRVGGLGLGLFITHHIIEHYKGKVWVESTEGQGSTFFFSLPRNVPSRAAGFGRAWW